MILEYSPKFVRDTLLKLHQADKLILVHDKILQFITSSDSDLKFGALRAVVNLVICLSPEERELFGDIVPHIGRALTVAFQNGVEEEIFGETLLLMLDVDLLFLTQNGKHTAVLMESMLNIAQMETLLMSSRHQAINLFLKLAEYIATSYPQIVEAHIRHLFKILLVMMTDGQDFDSWYNNKTDDHSSDIWQHNFIFVRDSLVKIFGTADKDAILNRLFHDMRTYALERDWKIRHALMLSISKIPATALSQDTVEQHMEKMINFTLIVVTDQNPRVRWPAVTAIKHLGGVLGDFHTYLSNFQDEVDSVLQPLITTERHDRIKVCLCAAREMFCK